MISRLSAQLSLNFAFFNAEGSQSLDHFGLLLVFLFQVYLQLSVSLFLSLKLAILFVQYILAIFDDLVLFAFVLVDYPFDADYFLPEELVFGFVLLYFTVFYLFLYTFVFIDELGD